jgi:hypothetical protein
MIATTVLLAGELVLRTHNATPRIDSLELQSDRTPWHHYYLNAMSHAPTPKTIHEDLVAALNALIAQERLLDKTDLRWKRIERDTAKLMKVDACLAWVTMGDLHSLAGDIAEMNTCFEKAMKIRPDELLYEHWAASFLNLGEVLAAQMLLADKCHPQRGHFSSKISLLQGVGAFHLLHAGYEKASAIGMSMSAALRVDAERTAAIVSLLDEAGLTDEDIGRAIGIVVRAIVSRGYFIRGGPAILVADEPGVFRGVTFMIQTPLSGDAFLDLAQEIVLAEEADPDLRKHPMFEVGILPVASHAQAVSEHTTQ